MNIPDLIQKQRVFFKSEVTKDLSFRRNLLIRLRKEIISKELEIYDALRNDFNKPEFESYLSEVGIVVSEIDLAIKNLYKWGKIRRVRPSLLNFPSKDYVISEPYGMVLIISPWNYPFQLAIAPVVAAVAAGNTVVLKPSELTPHTSQLTEQIISTVFNQDHVAVVQGGIPESTALLSERWDYIFFTGSVSVGKIIAKAAAPNLTPITLELGGKSPCIIDESVNVKLVAKRLVWGKYLNAGQTCIAPDYLIVHERIKNKLIDALKIEIVKAYGQDPEQSADYARIINAKNFERLFHMLGDVEISFGGEFNAETNYISPTLINDPELDSAVMQEEIFGPLLPILTFNSEEDIHEIVSNYDKPLSFYVFSNESEFSKRMTLKYSFGGGVINDTMIHFGNHRLPFGGVGESGMGAYHGRLGFDTFSHKKAIVKKSNWLDFPIRYAPYAGKLKTLKLFFKWLS